MANLVGTAVLMSDGSLRPIENIQAGDELASIKVTGYTDDELQGIDWKTNRLYYKKQVCIAQAIESSVEPVAISINNGLITSSAEHYHFVKRDGFCQYIKALELNRGDQLLSNKGQFIPIDNLEYLEGSFEFYKIDVESVDLYFINNVLTRDIEL